MNILTKNTNIIHRLFMDYPDSLKGISIEGNDLVLNGGQRINISNYDISNLIDGENPFFDEVQNFAPQDIFRIIRLHVMYLDSKNKESNVSDITVTEDSTSIPISKSPIDTQLARLELIQEENPLMKSVSIVNKPTESGLKQYFNIVDLQGKDHLFFNDVNIDVLAIYDELKAKSRKKVTPNQLIGAINRKIHEVKLEEADKAQENEVKAQNTQENNVQANENPVRLIPIKDFFRILDLGVKLEGNNKINTSLWYAYFGELMIYEDFLNVELKDILNGFRNYIVALQISDNMALNMNQVEACDRLYELEEKKHDYVIGQGEVEKVETQDKGMQYTYSLKDNAAFVAYVQIFSIVFSVATMLCALLIYVVSK